MEVCGLGAAVDKVLLHRAAEGLIPCFTRLCTLFCFPPRWGFRLFGVSGGAQRRHELVWVVAGVSARVPVEGLPMGSPSCEAPVGHIRRGRDDSLAKPNAPGYAPVAAVCKAAVCSSLFCAGVLTEIDGSGWRAIAAGAAEGGAT